MRAAVLGLSLVVGCSGLESESDGPPPVVVQNELPTVHLEVDAANLELLRRAILEGDPALGRKAGGNKPFVKGTYIDEHGVRHASKIAYRGLGQWHHHPEKPSLRIKIRKSALRSGHRNIELQRPEGPLAMRNWLPDRLGRSLGLLSVHLEHVRVFINGVYKGIYLRNIKPGSSLLMAAGRIPGTFFKGDNFTGSLWRDASEWKQRGETKEAVELFNQALLSMRQPVYPAGLRKLGGYLDMSARVLVDGPISAQAVRRVQTYIDMDAYTRWAALMIIAGSVHTDLFHNHLLHAAPERGKVEVVPVDVDGYGIQATPDLPVEVVRHPLAALLSRDPVWLHRRNVLLYELLQGPLSAENQIGLVREELGRTLPALLADPHLASLEKLGNPRPGLAGGYGLVNVTPEALPRKQRELEQWIRERASYILEHLRDARVAVTPSERGADSSRVWVFGGVAVAMTGRNGQTSAILHPGLSEEPTLFQMRPYRAPILVYAPSPVPLVYEVEGNAKTLSFANAVTGEPVVPSTHTPSTAMPARSIHPEAFEVLDAPRDTVVIGPGSVTISESFHVGSRQQLLIRAGTRLLMGPGVSIVSEGRVIVEGTELLPVEIVPSDEGKPWGTFGVVGAATRGSRFSHMKVRGGGAGTDGRVHFKGMFNIYESEDALIEHCEFGRNAHGDDAVSVASSTFIVRDSTWRDAAWDALDVDLGRGLIERSRFVNSGNDGLDVMGGVVIIRDSDFVGSGDKGISVGESAAVLGERLKIERNHIGIEVRDDSKVLLSQVVIDENEVGWRGYRKKKFYPSAGRGLLVDSHVGRSKVSNVSLEPLAELETVRTIIAPEELAPKVTALGAVPATWSSWAKNLEALARALSTEEPP